MGMLFVENFIKSYDKAPKKIIIDADDTLHHGIAFQRGAAQENRQASFQSKVLCHFRDRMAYSCSEV